MKMTRNILTSALLALLLIPGASAKEINGLPTQGLRPKLQKKASGCLPASFQTDLDINNIRARILNGGDMWWDLNSVAKYEVPKLNDPTAIKKNSLFAGAIWIGGLDLGSNLKVAAMTYRQSGSDYFPGPLDTISGTIEAARCKHYDRIFKVTRTEVEEFFKDSSQITDGIREWPGNGNPQYREARNLASFFDANGDGLYETFTGTEFPILDPGINCPPMTLPEELPDMMLYMVYNDQGNIHSETGGLPIGVELGTYCFAYQTNDEINNMTFYRTKITNRSSDQIRDCWFGQWVDADLGNYSDDYVGCDTTRSLGYCYNGDDNDEGILGYGLNPPSVGTDFFEGPRDSAGNEIGMRKFMYYENDFSVRGNPQLAEHYYNYLRGIWKDGSPMTFGGNGYQTGAPTSFMFPGDPFANQGWTERQAGNIPFDRRYLQSAGPFTLKPGAVNYVTVGVVWARTNRGGAVGSIPLLKVASDKAQKLFNNCFRITDGPRAPQVSLTILDRQVVVNMENTRDPRIEGYQAVVLNSQGQPVTYRFEGYILYQLANANVTPAELNDVDRARIAFQSDLRNSIDRIINFVFDPTVGADIPVVMVEGANQGIVHSMNLTEDLFAVGNTRMVNFKTYHYMLVAYAAVVNDPSEPEQFLAGRFNTRFSVIPNRPDPRDGGTAIQVGYADGPEVFKVEGIGNGGDVVELTPKSIEELMAKRSPPYHLQSPSYIGQFGPLKMKVIDPTRIQPADYEFRLFDSSLNQGQNVDSLRGTRTTWSLVRINPDGVQTSADTVYSDTTIAKGNEQIITKWGLALQVVQALNPGDPENEQDQSNGYLGSSIEWADNGRQWLTALEDQDITTGFFSFLNWIRAGVAGRNNNFSNSDYQDDFAFGGEPLDPFERYERPEKVIQINPYATNDLTLDRRIAPYALASRAPFAGPGRATFGPAYANSVPGNDNRLSELYSVDIVITPDKSKWTRCVVFEMSEDQNLAIGNQSKFGLRKATSLDQNFQPIPGDEGRSYFPGYAINVETGERLNMAFGEDSYLSEENGADMRWNPTSTFLKNKAGSTVVALGGKHYIYVMGSKRFGSFGGTIYDEGAEYQRILQQGGNEITNRRTVMAQVMWVMPAFLSQGYQMNDGVPVTEVKIRVRVKRSYGTRVIPGQTAQNNAQPYYRFSTKSIAPERGVEVGRRAIDLIGVVPNPYYAYSEYEGSQLDNRIKIINLPPKANIRIYSLNGTLVRQIKKDDPSTFVDWDLKNNAQVPIASGIYLIHVDAGELGTKILKWFGIMRQIDLDSF